ncbi:MAG: hypothetical protein RBS73_07730 [Prolixibacteraceae bacterium]|jgi:hypothetical protein|nr:hypothetical protein [Prolixibacteraceae bacterium]
MKKQTTRKFSMTYEAVITKSQSVQPQYTADLPAFAAFDPSFTPELGQELVAKTTLAIEDTSENTHSAAIQRKTDELSRLRSEAGTKYQKLMYFVHSAFGSNSKAVDSTFGRSLYAKAVKSEKQMITLLTLACNAARLDPFKAGLEAKGMPQDLVPSMEQLAADLQAADNEQEMLKKQQLLVTARRVELYNSIWDILLKINAASKVLYANDPVRIAIYQLYDPSSPKIPEADETSTTGE